jgi:hypothetical protein
VNADPETAGGSESANGGAQDAGAGVTPPAGGGVERPEAYVIPHAVAQATLDYLAAQPYREVYQLVRAFEALEPVPGSES